MREGVHCHSGQPQLACRAQYCLWHMGSALQESDRPCGLLDTVCLVGSSRAASSANDLQTGQAGGMVGQAHLGSPESAHVPFWLTRAVQVPQFGFAAGDMQIQDKWICQPQHCCPFSQPDAESWAGMCSKVGAKGCSC